MKEVETLRDFRRVRIAASVSILPRFGLLFPQKSPIPLNELLDVIRVIRRLQERRKIRDYLQPPVVLIRRTRTNPRTLKPKRMPVVPGSGIITKEL